MKADEAAKLLRYYCSKVQEACQLVRLPSKVSAAAVMFLQRAYVHASLLDLNPEELFLPCIYLACKVMHRPSCCAPSSTHWIQLNTNTRHSLCSMSEALEACRRDSVDAASAQPAQEWPDEKRRTRRVRHD